MIRADIKSTNKFKQTFSQIFNFPGWNFLRGKTAIRKKTFAEIKRRR